jgi:hypothetical protein
MVKRSLITAALLASSAAANAAVVVQFTGNTGNEWHYDVSLSPGALLESGNFFTVYDFKGLQNINWSPVVGTASDWSTSQSATSTAPFHINPGDNPGIDNATVTFSGPNFDPGNSKTLLGTLTLTGLTSGPVEKIVFGSQAVEKGQATPLGFLAQTSGPSAVPEPSTIGLMVGGLLGVAAFARRRMR